MLAKFVYLGHIGCFILIRTKIDFVRNLDWDEVHDIRL